MNTLALSGNVQALSQTLTSKLGGRRKQLFKLPFEAVLNLKVANRHL